MDSLPKFVSGVVLLCWLAFLGIFFFRRKLDLVAEQKKDRGSIVGFLLQGLSLAVVWGVRRPPFTPFVRGGKAVEIFVSLVAVVAGVASVVIIMAAVKVLGKEWSITARVVEGHKLATEGPYRFVRHPIYTGMLGMLLANGIAISSWPALLVALVILFIGTVIRVRSEERLLREAFGSEFDTYARKVPAIVPGLY